MKQWLKGIVGVLMALIVIAEALSAQEKLSIKSKQVSRSLLNSAATVDQFLSCTGGIQEIGFGANNTYYWARNDGSIAYRASATDYGFEFPRTSGYSLVYAGGFYLGGLKKGGTGIPDTVNVFNCEFETEGQPGRILNSGPFGTLIAENYIANPTFHQLPGDEACWPAEAPNNGSGQPLKLSQLDTWTVFNDLSINRADTSGNGPRPFSPGFGIEVQRQTFQFLSVPCSNAVLVRMKIINKSDRSYPDFYIGIWNDPDVGSEASDDLSGVDSNISLGYTYSNPAGSDVAKTAYGCLLLQGPITADGAISDTAILTTINEQGFTKIIIPDKRKLQATAFIAYPNPAGEPSRNQGDNSRYYYMKGLTATGGPRPGGAFDIGAGSAPSDQRFILSSGPFTFAPGDSQEIWYAMIGAQGSSNANAVPVLLDYANQIRNQFNNNINSIVGIDEAKEKLPNGFALHQNYPNPFNPSTVISYQLPVNSKVSLKIYNLLGQEIRTLVNGTQSAGLQTIQWDGKDNRGQAVSSGVYFYRLETPGFTKTMKMMMMR
jgi:hypothetical protein